MYQGHFSFESFCNFGSIMAIFIRLSSFSFSPKDDSLLPVFLHCSHRHGHSIVLLIRSFKAFTHFGYVFVWCKKV